MPHAGVSAYGAKIISAIQESGRAYPVDNGGWRVGAKKIPAALGRDLLCQDILAKAEEGCLVISVTGMAWLKRHMAHKESPTSSPFIAQHQSLVTREIKIAERYERRAVNITDSPLDWLVSRKGKDGMPLIGPAHYEAGCRLRDDYETSHLQPKMAFSYEPIPVSQARRGASDLNMSERRLAAQSRYDAAVVCMGPDLADVARRVCCGQQGLRTVEAELGWPVRSAKIVLRIALERLANHYGIRG